MSYRDEEEAAGNGFAKETSVSPHRDHVDNEISRVVTSGTDNEYIHIGNTKVLRSELVNAFGGDLYPSAHAAPSRKLANPAPLGLAAFALTTFLLSICNVQTRGVQGNQIVVPTAYFYGGVVQLIAGVFEIIMENTFGAVALASYGGFWISFAAVQTEGFGVTEAYTRPEDLSNAVGFFLVAWAIFTFLMMVCTIRSTVCFFMMFFTVDITFWLLAASNFTGSVGCAKAGGWFGIAAAFFAWYNAFAGIITKENSYITVTPIYMPFSQHPAEARKSN